MPNSADIPVVQTEGNIAVSPAVTTNLTVVIATIVSLCVLTSLIICVILYFKKRRSKINRQCRSTTEVLKCLTLLNCHCHSNGLLKRRKKVMTVNVIRT